MRETIASILWRRLDVEGHDGCRLLSGEEGRELEGQASFEEGGEPCCLAYRVSCDRDWLTRSATVRGFLGSRGLDYDIERHADGTWKLNGALQPQVEGLIDVDLNFTPATNLLAIRRFSLAVGAETPAPAAWLTFPEPKLIRLDQTYRRLDEARYAYRGYDYAETLKVSPAGFVLEYPGLWKVVAGAFTRPA
jgi:hypothetical protein